MPKGTEVTTIGNLAWYRTGHGRVTVVFLHGFLTNSRLWAEVVEPLAERARCLLIDLPLGAHDYPAKPGADLSAPSLARAAAQVIAAQATGPVVLVGSDAGGVVAQIIATEHRELITHLVLLPCGLDRAFLPPLLRYLRLAAWIPGTVPIIHAALRIPAIRRLPIAYGWLVRRRLSASAWAAQHSSLARPRIQEDLARALRAASRTYSMRAAHALRETSLPVTLLWADTPHMFPIAAARRFARAMRDVHLIAVEGAYAFVHLDRPALVAHHLAEIAGDAAPAH